MDHEEFPFPIVCIMVSYSNISLRRYCYSGGKILRTARTAHVHSREKDWYSVHWHKDVVATLEKFEKLMKFNSEISLWNDQFNFYI